MWIEAEGDVVPREANERNKQVPLKIFAPITDRISKINNTKANNEKYQDVVMSMYKLIVCKNNYAKKSGRLWQ